ncbi:MAG: serine/threonine protein kinase [Bryobacterales bacterium]|nr:serine/threonine protein kinase [Bryobacterales bacterium]
MEEELGRGEWASFIAFDTTLRLAGRPQGSPAGHDDDPGWRFRLLHEARAAAALNHPNIIAVYEAGSYGGESFIAMELVDGKPLDKIVPPDGLPFGQTLTYAEQIADALVKAHGSGVIHGDLKPRNVMVTSGGLLKVLDFGLARHAAPGESETDSAFPQGVFGTPSYMSPEQARGEELDARSDLFSFGALLYEMTTGVMPFRASHHRIRV